MSLCLELVNQGTTSFIVQCSDISTFLVTNRFIEWNITIGLYLALELKVRLMEPLFEGLI